MGPTLQDPTLRCPTFGCGRCLPIQFWPIQFWPVHFWPILVVSGLLCVVWCWVLCVGVGVVVGVGVFVGFGPFGSPLRRTSPADPPVETPLRTPCAGPPCAGHPTPHCPKFRSFFPSPAPFSLFLSLSGCLLVEFWWCFRRPGPYVGAAVASHDSPGTPPNVHIGGPRRFIHHQNSTEDTQRDTKRAKMAAGEGKKSEILGHHPSGLHFSGLGGPTLRGHTFRGLGGPTLRWCCPRCCSARQRTEVSRTSGQREVPACGVRH